MKLKEGIEAFSSHNRKKVSKSPHKTATCLITKWPSGSADLVKKRMRIITLWCQESLAGNIGQEKKNPLLHHLCFFTSLRNEAFGVGSVESDITPPGNCHTRPQETGRKPHPCSQVTVTGHQCHPRPQVNFTGQKPHPCPQVTVTCY